MRLKWVVKLITLMVFFTSSMFAFELSSNHYGGFGKLLKGKQTYLPSMVFPFSEAIQVDSNFEAIFYTEKLPSILTENHSKFYLYTTKYQSEFTDITINGIEIPDSNISITPFYKDQNQVQLVELKVSNAIIIADEVAKINVKSHSDVPFWIYQQHISNHFEIFPTQIVFKKNGNFYRKYALISQCSESIKAISIEFRNQTFDVQFKAGYQLQTFELPLIDKEAIFTAKVFVDGLLYGTEDVKTQGWIEHSIHLIPIIKGNHVQDWSSEIPLEINQPSLDVSHVDHEVFSRQVNYSIQIDQNAYRNQLGFLQEEDILKYSTILYDRPYPSRAELGRMMDLNIKTLGYFQRERYGYPESYTTKDNMAYLFEDAASRELLVYKQYNSIVYKSKKQLEDHIIEHEYKLKNNTFPFKQSALFVEFDDQNDVNELNKSINHWTQNHQSPFLSIDNFNQFGKLFVNKNRVKLAHHVQSESPFRINYDVTDKFSVDDNWRSTLSMEPSLDKEINDSKFSVFNPNSDKYSGIMSITHRSTMLTHAEWKDGTPVKLQQYKPNHYYVLVEDLNPFELKTLKVFERTANTMVKPKIFSMHRRTGLINWQYKGHKLSKRKEDLFVPIIKNGLNTVSLSSDKGFLKQRGILFSEFEKEIITDNGAQIQINSYVFNDLPLVKYTYRVQPANIGNSTHIRFNFSVAPTQYSIDRLYKEEYGFSKFGNHNVIESEQSVFLINKTKIVLSSPQNLRWQYNAFTYNSNEVGFIRPSTYPNQMYLLVSGDLNGNISDQKAERIYELDVLLGDENEDIELPQTLPICMDNLRLKQSELELFKLDNSNIQVVSIHPTEKSNQFVLELKNTSDGFENTTFTPRKNKSTVYECLISGKKIGILKGKIEFTPQELKTIRISL